MKKERLKPKGLKKVLFGGKLFLLVFHVLGGRDKSVLWKLYMNESKIMYLLCISVCCDGRWHETSPVRRRPADLWSRTVWEAFIVHLGRADQRPADKRWHDEIASKKGQLQQSCHSQLQPQFVRVKQTLSEVLQRCFKENFNKNVVTEKALVSGDFGYRWNLQNC